MASLITIGNGASKKYKLTWDVNTTDGTRKRKSKKEDISNRFPR